MLEFLDEEWIAAFDNRFAPVRLPYNAVAVVGVPDGALLSTLRERFPTAEQIDHVQDMASLAGRFDLLIAHFVLPGVSDWRGVLRQWRRCLRPGGILFVTALGPDTLSELPDQMRQPATMDMHDLGDALVQAGFAEPVLDVEHLTVTYRDEKKCLREMREGGLMVPGSGELSFGR